jgi:hypothetical protein
MTRVTAWATPTRANREARARLRRLAYVFVAAIFPACTPEPTHPNFLPRQTTASNTTTCVACVFGPTTWTRKAGGPVLNSATFEADPNADYVIDIDQSDSQGAVPSVALNGVVLLAARATGEDSPRHIRKSVQLLQNNVVEVWLAGKPGSTLTVSIIGGAKVIGSTGGSLVIPGGRLTLNVPPGALSVSTEITLSEGTAPNWTDPSLTPVGFTYSIDLNGQTLNSPAEVRFALPDVDNDGHLDGTGLPNSGAAFLRYDPTSNEWIQPLQWLEEATKTLVVQSRDFSVWSLFVPTIWSGLPRELRWDIDMSNAPAATSIAAFSSQLQFAFSLWQAETNAAGLTFRRANAGETPNIVVEFADLPFDSPSLSCLSLSCTTYGRVKYGLQSKKTIQLNRNQFPWVTNSFLTDVVIHEIGHSIGMWHIGNGNEPPIMAPIPNFTANLQLHPADVDQIRRKYGVRSPLQLTVVPGFVFALTLSNSRLLFTDYSVGSVNSVLTNGTLFTSLKTDLPMNGPAGIVSDGASFFWTQIGGGGGGGSIRRAPIGGGITTTLANFATLAAPLKIDGPNLFFWADGSLKKMSKDGVNILNVVPAGGIGADGVAFTVHQGVVYYLDGYEIRRVPIQGGLATTMTSSAVTASDLLVVGGTLYWTNPFSFSCPPACGNGIFSLPITASGQAATTKVAGMRFNNLASDGVSLFARGTPGVFQYSLPSFANPRQLATFGGNGGGYGLVVDDESVYWSHFGAIYKTLKY